MGQFLNWHVLLHFGYIVFFTELIEQPAVEHNFIHGSKKGELLKVNVVRARVIVLQV